jgi:Xaa-Pro aminopeptidase
MTQDTERMARIQDALKQEDLDAVIVSLPGDVLMLSGYWPVTGTAIAIATRDGQFGILAPNDEQHLAARGWADPLHTFTFGSLTRLETLTEAVREPLASLRDRLGLHTGRIGYRTGPSTEASAYAAIHLYESSIQSLCQETFPNTTLVPANAMLKRLRGVQTPLELIQIRRACEIADKAFQEGAKALRVGLRETEAAVNFQNPFSTYGVGYKGVFRADGFVYCMAGSDSVQASGAYARSRAREIQTGELVLVHCNSYADGFWTDITRTFHMGTPDTLTQGRRQAVMEARQAALETIAPGVSAADVDHAARSVLKAHGLGDAFPHATGHGVGFDAFNPNALSRIHPVSLDILEVGMVFNIEPAVYLEGWGGLRHCDMVTVTEKGCEVLTPFLAEPASLTIG